MAGDMTGRIISKPSPNFNDRRGAADISMLILHYTGMISADAALERLCDPTAEVSAHYLVDEAGEIYRLVEEEKRAWHAGVGFWRGVTDINSASIGIEIVNPGHEFGYVPFSEIQMQAVLDLSRDITARHHIQPFNVVGHSDIAPTRKQDPGELFDWQRLAATGVGMWAEPTTAAGAGDFLQALETIGYEIPESPADHAALITAFQRHWRPSDISGVLDDETRQMAFALEKEVRRLTS